MISALTTLLLVVIMFLTGKIFEGIKRFLVLIVSIFLKLLNLFGIQINLRERRERTSKKFKQTFKDIRVVKRSKQNEKITPSVNAFALIILIIGIIVVVINLTYDGVISQWIYTKGIILNKIFSSADQVDTTLTATMFSAMAFSLSKLISQWKDTAKYRRAKKEIKLKNKVMSNISSKELLDIAKQKDADRFNSLMGKTSSESGDTNSRGNK